MPKKRLLIIEDDPDVSEMLQTYFTSQGYDIYAAYTGLDGVATARAKSPNLILLDVMLPDMDGFDVCKQLRTTTLTKYIPITFLTQRDRRSDKVAGLELGADDYVTKPFDIEELRLRVQISLRRASRETPQDLRTGLPTAGVVDETRNQLMQATGWAHLDLQISGFGAFRDAYGFVAADEVLAFAGRVITEAIAELGTPRDFAGTYAEDKFTIFTFVADAQPLIDKLEKTFRDGVRLFYNALDAERGFVLTNEGQPNELRVALMHFVTRRVDQFPIVAAQAAS